MFSKTLFTETDLIFHQGLWHAWDAHGDFSKVNSRELLADLNDTLITWHEAIGKAKILMLTPGTAYVYKHLETHRDVANCHKVPQQAFEKYLLPADRIVNELEAIITKIRKINPEVKILLTVSPVKHLRDGMVENSLSKAILLQASHQLTTRLPHCYYFPAYELVTDDLRDYRFFESDMAHPNQQAIDYVWEKFSKAYFSERALSLQEKLEDIMRAYSHRPLKPDTAEFRKFKEVYTLKCLDLQREYPFLDLERERTYFMM